MRTLQSLPAAVVLTAVLAGCSGSTGPGGSSETDPPKLTIVPSVAAIESGGSIRLTAQVSASDGTQWTPADLTWRSSDSSVASVGPGGLVQAVSAGDVQIVGEWEGTTSVARVKVTETAQDPGSGCAQASVMASSISAKPHGCQ
jgi:uncharacterized protein YjdB